MTTTNSDTELLTEHFGYPPVVSQQSTSPLPTINCNTNEAQRQSLLDEIINSINFLAEKALSSVETSLLNAPPQQIGFGKPPNTVTIGNSKAKRKRKQPSPPPPEENAPEMTAEEIEEQACSEIASGTHQLETLLCTSIDRNFDKFELYVMRNILCVKPEDRDWIRLGHYEGLNFENLPPSVLKDGTNTDDGDRMDVDEEQNPDVPTVDSVNKLRRRLQASQKLNTMLTAEKTRNDALLGELRAVFGRTTMKHGVPGVKQEDDEDKKAPFAFLHNKGDLSQADAATPLTTTTAFSLSQMQALRALSTSLSNILSDLKPQTAHDHPDADADESAALKKKTWRKERVEYVEGATRRHLESVRGLELGRNGEVRDGEWQGEGRRFAGGEVGALEKVVEMLGTGGSGREDKEEGNAMGEDEEED